MKVVFLIFLFTLLVGLMLIPTVRAQVTYPEVQSLPFFTTVGDYKQAAPEDLATAIFEQFGIKMVGFDKEQLTWTWELFKQISNTNFKSLTAGAIVQKFPNDHSYSAQVGCKNHTQADPFGLGYAVQLHPHTDAVKFKLTLLHELAHVIYNCNGPKSTEWNKAFEVVIAEENGITRYGENPGCIIGFSDSNFAGRRRSEDFAETIAYYLIPDAPERTIEGNCQPTGGPPFKGGTFPVHFEFAKSILGNL